MFGKNYMNIQEWIESGKPWNVILHGDCMDLMKHFNDNEIHLCITDPPHGTGGGLKGGRPFSMLGGEKWDKEPDEKYFNELKRISENQIIWGGNYFNLGRTRGFIIWHKENDGRDFSECEFAWSSFEKPSRIYKKRFIGKKESRHPTEKPVALYRWILQNYAKPNDKIIDTHSGSGSCAIACFIEHHDFLAIEKDEDYHKASVARYNEVIAQGRLF
jgi:site-specific DNA-methyltransferase (adenine-specific)